MGFLGLIILAAYCAFSEWKTATQCYTHSRETGRYISTNQMMTTARKRRNDAMCHLCVSKTVSKEEPHLEKRLVSQRHLPKTQQK